VLNAHNVLKHAHIFKKLFDDFIIAVKGTEKEFTTGSIRRALYLLAIPMILEMVMESIFAIVDMYFISRLGDDEAIAAIGLTESFMFIIMSIALGLASATIAIVARRIGEEKYEKAAEAGGQAMILSVIIGVIIGIIGFYYAEDLLHLMGSEPSLIKVGSGYTRIILTFNIILIFLYVNNAIFRAAGDASFAMRTLILANGLNIILDPCLIFGLWFFPQWGLEGAAIATCIGRGIGVCYQFYHLFNAKNIIKMMWSHLKPVGAVMKRLLHISAGGAGQHIITSCSWVFMVYIINQFGAEAMSGYTIAIRVIMFTLLPSWGLSIAASTLVGQNLGAKKPERAEQSAWAAAKYNMIFLVLVSVFFFVSADPIIEIFSVNPEVIRIGALALKIICAGYIFFAYEMVIGQCFNGAGDTYTPTFLNFICFWLLQIPLSYVLAVTLNWGPTGVFVAIAISSSVLAVLAIWIFRKGKWKTISV